MMPFQLQRFYSVEWTGKTIMNDEYVRTWRWQSWLFKGKQTIPAFVWKDLRKSQKPVWTRGSRAERYHSDNLLVKVAGKVTRSPIVVFWLWRHVVDLQDHEKLKYQNVWWSFRTSNKKEERKVIRRNTTDLVAGSNLGWVTPILRVRPFSHWGDATVIRSRKKSTTF
jgi:hypothetical protein